MKLAALWGKKAETKQRKVDVREAYALWDVLNSKYLSLEKIIIYKPYANDPHLKIILEQMEKEIIKNIDILVRQMNAYSIPSPPANRAGVTTPVHQQVFLDELIVTDLLFYEQEHLENLLFSFYSFITNDKLRGVMGEMLLGTMEKLDDLTTQMAARGWIAVPPAFKHRPPEVMEDIHLGEVGCLWDMLTYRYDTKHFTETMLTIVHDMDLQGVMKLGIEMLEEQVKLLEKELAHFGVSMPRRPPEVTTVLDNKDLYLDSQIFRSILLGMQGAGVIHARSVKISSANKRVRSLFKRLLHEEVKNLDALIRFGKLKGWLHNVPFYGP